MNMYIYIYIYIYIHIYMYMNHAGGAFADLSWYFRFQTWCKVKTYMKLIL